MQPGGEGRFATKGIDLAEQPQEDILRQTFRLRWVSHHTKAQGVNLSAVQPIDSFERVGIALLSESHDIGVRQLSRFGLSWCAHGIVLRIFACSFSIAARRVGWPYVSHSRAAKLPA